MPRGKPAKTTRQMHPKPTYPGAHQGSHRPPYLFIFPRGNSYHYFRRMLTHPTRRRIAMILSILLAAFLVQCAEKDDMEPGPDDPGIHTISISGHLSGPTGTALSSTQPPTSNSQKPTANSQHPATNTQPPTSNSQQPTANSQHPAPSPQPPKANTQPPTSNSQKPKAKSQHPKANTQEPTANPQHPIPHAPIRIYRISDFIAGGPGAEPISQATTDASGNYTASDIPPGSDLLLIAGTSPRLSAIVLQADAQSTADVNSATTLAAEYFGPGLGQTIPSDNQLKAFTERAEDVIGALTEEDALAEILAGLLPENFGEGFPDVLPGSLQLVLDQLAGIQLADCSEIRFSTLTGQPGTVVTINGIPEEFGAEPYLWLYQEGKSGGDRSNRSPVFIERTGGEEAVIYVPVNPDSPMGGGAVVLVLESEDNTLSCSPVRFTIEPLDPAPGAFETVVDELEQGLYQMIEAMGGDPDLLKETNVSQLPPEWQGLAVGLQGIGGPDDPGSLRSLLSGKSLPGLKDGIDEESLGLIEAVMVSSGFSQHMNELSQAMKDFAPDKNLPQGNARKGGSFRQPGKQGGAPMRTSFRQAGHREAVPMKTEGVVLQPAVLQGMMVLQNFYEIQNAQVLRATRDAAGVIVATVGIFATAGAIVPVAAASALIGTVMTLSQLMYDLGENLNPHRLEGFLMEAEPAVYDEDDPTIGEWQAQLIAKSHGYTLNWPAMVGLIPGFGGIGKVVASLTRANPAIQQGVETGIQLGLEMMRRVLELTEEVGFTVDPKNFIVEFDPRRDSEDLFFEWEMRTIHSERPGNPFEFDPEDELQYIPRQVGTSEIRINTVGGIMFKGQVVNNNRELTMNPITVDVVQQLGEGFEVNPPVYIEVGDEVHLYARVENAIDTKVDWRVSPDNNGLSLSWVDENDLIAVGVEPGVYVVVAESATRTGARAENNPVRLGSARVYVESLWVKGPDCLERGEIFEMEAYMGEERISFSELDWTITGPGNLGNTGLYSSGTAGDVHIEFWLKNNDDIRTEVSFEVRVECPLLYEYDISIIGGPIAGHYSGSFEYDEESEEVAIGSYLDLEAMFGITGKVIANLNMPTRNIWIMMGIVLENGEPMPLGPETGDQFQFSGISLVVSDMLAVCLAGSVTVSNFETQVFEFIGTETAWSGTIEFSGEFYLPHDETIPPFSAHGRVVIQPLPTETKTSNRQ